MYICTSMKSINLFCWIEHEPSITITISTVNVDWLHDILFSSFRKLSIPTFFSL